MYVESLEEHLFSLLYKMLSTAEIVSFIQWKFIQTHIHSSIIIIIIIMAFKVKIVELKLKLKN